MIEYLLKRPMLICGIGCIIISVIAFYMPSLLVCLLILLSFVIGITIYRTGNKKALFMMFLLFIMTINSLCSVNKITRFSDGESCSAELTLISTDYKCEDYYISTVRVNRSDTLPFGTKLKLYYEPESITAGSSISADINFSAINNSYSKMDSYSKGIYFTGSMKNIKFSDRGNNFILSKVEKLRNHVKTTLFKNMKYNEASTLCALIYGNKDYFSKEFYDNVKFAGVAHIMVVSGMHLSIIVGIVNEFSKRCFYNRYLKGFLIILTALFVSALCGFTMSILRAGLTYFIMAIGIMLDRKGKSDNTLGMALTIILISSPFAIFNLAFQLSMLSTFGILAVALPIMSFIKKRELIKSEWIIKPLNIILMTFSATLLTLPVIIYIFGYISLVAVISNLLVSFAVTIDIYLIAAALILSAIFPFYHEIMFYPAYLVTAYINSVINKLGSLPYSSVEIPRNYAFLSIFLIFAVMEILLACKNRINMLKLEKMRIKINEEGGKRIKWR